MNNTWVRCALAIVLVHAAVSLPHSLAHIADQIWLPPAASAFVVLVILFAPFVALGLLYARRPRLGAAVLFWSMVGALVFGIAYHFVIPGADNVAQVPHGPWRTPFVATSVLLAVVEAAGAVLGAAMLFAARRSPAAAYENRSSL